MSIKRYEMDHKGLPFEDVKGSFVLHEDHAAEVARLNEQLSNANEKIDKIKSNCCHVDTSKDAVIPNSLDAWGRTVPQFLPYDFSGNPGASATQYCNGWNDAGGYWLNYVKQMEEQVRALVEFKNKVRQLFKMGELAEDFAVFVNIENALRRSGCLDAMEREFFTREVPDEDYPDEMCEECNLYWGKNPGEYVADFAGELNEVRAQALDEANLAIANTGDFANVFKVLAEMSARIRAGEQS